MLGMNWIESYLKGKSFADSGEYISSLAKSEYSRIRLHVAEHPSTPPAVLEQLSKDDDSDVRAAVATNPAAPIDVVKRLALDDNANVRFAIAEDPNIPVAVLKILAEDENAYVCCRAQKTLKALGHSEHHENEKHRFLSFPIFNSQCLA